MRNFEFVKEYSFGENVLLVNNTNYSVIVISSYIHSLIDNINEVDDLKLIAREFEEDDVSYFKSLHRALSENKVFVEEVKEGINLINFAITDDCNLFCSHCCYSAGYIDKAETRNCIEVDMRIVKKIVELNPLGIVITGGEPLLVDNFNEMMSYINENFQGRISLATNATLINKDNVESLCSSFDSFDISLDGINAEMTDKIRGKGTYNKVIGAIELLQKNGVKNIVVSMTFDNNTIKYDRQFLDLCKKLNVEPKIRALNLTGRAEKRHNIGSEKMMDFMSGGIANITGAYNCPGGVNEIFLNSRGEVYPCALFNENEFNIGNILDKNFAMKLKWDESLKWFDAFKEFIPETRQECKECEVNFFCWNCPALMKSYLKTTDSYILSDHCELKKKKIIEAIENA